MTSLAATQACQKGGGLGLPLVWHQVKKEKQHITILLCSTDCDSGNSITSLSTHNCYFTFGSNKIVDVRHLPVRNI